MEEHTRQGHTTSCSGTGPRNWPEMIEAWGSARFGRPRSAFSRYPANM
jgi:hypothetical protein